MSFKLLAIKVIHTHDKSQSGNGTLCFSTQSLCSSFFLLFSTACRLLSKCYAMLFVLCVCVVFLHCFFTFHAKNYLHDFSISSLTLLPTWHFISLQFNSSFTLFFFLFSFIQCCSNSFLFRERKQQRIVSVDLVAMNPMLPVQLFFASSLFLSFGNNLKFDF